MYNAVDFIDSPDIREYNKDTKFTPGEQACLILLSRSTPIATKRNALIELLTNYTDEDLCGGHWFIEGVDSDRNEQAKHLRMMAQREMALWDIAEHLIILSNGAIFAGFDYELGEGGINPRLYCYHHSSEFHKLKKLLIDSLDDDIDINNVRYHVTRIFLDDPKGGSNNQIDYVFNGNFELIEIDIPEHYHPDYNEDDETVWVHNLNVLVQLPFKKGDILKYIDTNNHNSYGLLQSDPYVSEEDFDWHLTHTHVNAMGVNLEGICDIDQYANKYRIWYNHVARLDLVKCEDTELDSLEERCLKVLQNIKYGDNDWEGFMDLVNHTGFLFDRAKHI